MNETVPYMEQTHVLEVYDKESIPLIEKESVHDVYDNIANQFDSTRRTVWGGVGEFLNSLQKGSIVADIGCGNGKNMLHRKDITCFGCDASVPLVIICKQKKLDVVVANCVDLPFKDNFFDATICIAVIHHLSTVARRRKAIEEIVRITKSGGQIYIQVWAYEQKTINKFKLTTQDAMISWNGEHNRYYHMFVKGELDELFEGLPIDIIDSFYEMSNFGVLVRKK